MYLKGNPFINSPEKTIYFFNKIKTKLIKIQAVFKKDTSLKIMVVSLSNSCLSVLI